MKTVLNVKTDKDVKERAQALAKHLGIPLSTVVNIQLKSFIETGELRVTREPELRPEVIKELNLAIKEVQTGKNMSPRFSNAADAIAWLNK
jgi:addiction module RelB/DinJ family antitoxin